MRVRVLHIGAIIQGNQADQTVDLFAQGVRRGRSGIAMRGCSRSLRSTKISPKHMVLPKLLLQRTPSF